MGRKIEKLVAPDILMFGKIASVACSETPVMILGRKAESHMPSNIPRFGQKA
jgi:hypothetical protein